MGRRLPPGEDLGKKVLAWGKVLPSMVDTLFRTARKGISGKGKIIF
jgi:hypothetical protein